MAVVSAARAGVRALQAVSALVAMIFVSLGYIEYTSGQLSSGAAIFSTLANYSALLCGAYYVSPLFLLQLSKRAPRVLFQRAIDAALAAALALAGALHATSEAVQNCDSHNAMFEGYHGRTIFRCGNMSVGIAATFVTAALCLVSLAQSFVRDSAASASTATAAATGSAESTDAVVTHELDEPAYATVFTPTSKPLQIGATATASAAYSPALRAVRLGGRAVQFACALLAFICMVAGYRHYYTGQYLSPKSMYAILTAYTCTVYSFWHLVAVHKLRLSRRPSLAVERATDAALAFALLVAGVVVATSAHVRNCDASNDKFKLYHGDTLFRCGSMNSGVVFTFLAVAAYAGTVAASYVTGAVAENQSARDSAATVDEHADAGAQA